MQISPYSAAPSDRCEGRCHGKHAQRDALQVCVRAVGSRCPAFFVFHAVPTLVSSHARIYIEVGVMVDCGSRSPIFLFNLDTQELMGAFTPTASSYAVEPATHRLSLVRPFSPWLAPRPCALALARLPCRPMLATGACCMAYIESVGAATLTTSGPSRPLTDSPLCSRLVCVRSRRCYRSNVSPTCRFCRRVPATSPMHSLTSALSRT